MKQDTAPHSASLFSRLFDHYLVWVWGAVGASIIICSAISWLHYYQQNLLLDAASELSAIRQARIDFAKGFLHVSLSDNPMSPFDRDQGLALLDQATKSLSKIVRFSSAPQDFLVKFSNKAQQFRDRLTASNSSDHKHRDDILLRTLFYDLERYADDIDGIVRQKLYLCYSHLNTAFIFTIAGAILLLGGFSFAIFIVGKIHKKNHALLRESEERLRILGDNLPDSAVYQYVYEPDGRVCFLHISAGIERLNGISVEDVLGDAATLHRQIPREYVEKLIEAEAKSARELSDFAMEIPMLRPDGELRWMRLHSRPRRMSDGCVLWDGVQMDITERKRVEEALRENEAKLLLLNAELEQRVADRTDELKQTNAYLEKANRAKDEFLATMSHELRTPLTGILGISESLLEQIFGPLNEKQQKYVRTIESSGEHLLQLINDILDLSKIEAGRTEPHFEVVSVADICHAGMAFVRSPALRKHIDLSFLCEPTSFDMVADERRMKQILVNLLGNAVKFTPDGGKVSLHVNADPQSSVICFVVEDTGIGIAPEDISRLFKPFTQLDSSLSRQHEGTGLGLALVKKLAELHDGNVTVESEVGKGSRFTVTIPWRQCMGECVLLFQ